MIFSKRIGKVVVRTDLQLESMDDFLRNGLWDIYSGEIFNGAFQSTLSYGAPHATDEFKDFLSKMWHFYFKQPVDTAPYTESDVKRFIREYFFSCHWYEVYDLIEFSFTDFKNTKYPKYLNNVLERELSAYRVVDWSFHEITNKIEIESIEKAITSAKKYKGAHIHLTSALNFLNDRKSPDYRNSIKESISAVESICIDLTGEKSNVLGNTLAILEKQYGLHGALKKSFSSLYGYTSDSDGIRHALMEIPDLSYEDAYFFFIQCSSFTYYLINKFKK